MSLRLSGWQRIGIVASALWAIGAGLVTRLNDARGANLSYRVAYDTCREREKAQQHNDFSVCHEEGWKAYQLSLADSWEDVAIVALVPIPFGWLLAYIVVGVWRWVRRGFNVPPPP
jgi:hypothetical protein